MPKRLVTTLTSIVFLAASLVMPVAEAGIISTQAYVEQAQSDAERDRVAEMLKREDVRERMLAMGVDPAQVEARLAGLSDAELAELAAGMDELPAGAGVVEVLLFVVLVFVILDIAGVTDVFPFIESAK